MFRRKTLGLETAVVGLSLAALVVVLRRLLLDGAGILPHDNYYWCYPIFHFFAEGITQGRMPLWNPFMHGGEPFYLLMGQIRLFDPIAALTPLVARYFTNDTATWFNWTRVLQAVAMATGAYLVLRPLARVTLVRLSLFPILLFSSFVLGTFPQDGILASFAWIPYLCWFALRLVHRKGSPWANWPGLALTTGLGWQSYHFAGTWVFLAIAAAGMTVFHRRWWRRIFRGEWRGPALLGACLVGMMAMPNAALYLEREGYVFPLRMAPPDFRTQPPYGGPVRIEGDPTFETFGWWMPLDFVRYTGGSVQPWDLLQMVAPDGNPATHGDPNGGWGAPSESYIYFGLIPWALGLFGLCLGRHRKKSLALWITVAFALLMLGFKGGLFPLIRPLLPPLWGLRNTGLLVSFFELGFLYFFLLGADRVFRRKQPLSPIGLGFFLVLVVAQLCTALYFAGEPGKLAFRWAWTLGLPAAVILLAPRFGWKRAVAPVVAAVLVLDLATHVARARLLREGMEHPSQLLGVSTEAKSPVFPETRAASPRQPRVSGRPPVRYFPLLEKKSYAFSEVVTHKAIKDPVEEAWRGSRWNSFYLTRSYFDWIHQAPNSQAIRQSFAIGGPTLALEGGQVNVVQYDYDSLTVDTRSPHSAKLSWSDGYDPHWEAEIDGKPIHVERWQANFKAVTVPAGHHRVRFFYRPRFFLVALCCFYSALALGLTVMVASVGFSKARKAAIIPSWRALPDSSV